GLGARLGLCRLLARRLGLLPALPARALAALVRAVAAFTGAVAAGLFVGRLEGLVVDRLLVGLGGRLQQRLRRGQALELLPVAGLLQDREHRLAGLRPHGEPVLHPLGVDLDVARVLLRVVLADLLDGLAITLGPRVGDDNAVVRRPDLAQALQPDLHSHGCGVSSMRQRGVSVASVAWGYDADILAGSAPTREGEGPRRKDSTAHCARAGRERPTGRRFRPTRA